MAELGRSVDELELDLLQSVSACLRQEGASQSDGPLLAAGNGALQHRGTSCTACT
jgi:hypothetical protein